MNLQILGAKYVTFTRLWPHPPSFELNVTLDLELVTLI